jgi:hypothetical protein
LGKGKGVLLVEDGGDYRVEPLHRMAVSDSRPVRANERCTAPWAGHAEACRA